jgi:uncharacterized protein YdaU (DUF1376 family)
MNYYELHIGDFIRDTVSLTMLEEGAYRRLIDQAYQTERPLPVDKKMVYRLARANTAPEKKAVDFVLSSYFQLTDDGYVQKRIQQEIERYWERDQSNETKRENDRDRQQRARDRRKQLFDDLRSHGIVPEFNTPTKQLQAIFSRVTNGDENGDVTQSVTRDNTATQTPDTKHQTPVLKPLAHRASDQPELARGVEPSKDVEKQEVTPTPAALLSQAMRKHGVMSNPGDPRLIALGNQGVSVETIEAACEEAKTCKPGERIGPAYVAAIIERWSKEAKAIDVAGAKPPQAPQREDWSWKKSREGIDAKGRELGMYARGSESYDDFAARIQAALDKRKGKPKTAPQGAAA